ncbi:MAG: ROK family transcriptional regulator [Phycisphaerales bacterium]|nr:MAG: ROK family transcriptional regulator [Phycisphaerales bacterium]
MNARLTGTPQLNRMVNRRLILERIRRSGKTSRAELAESTAIRPPTVSAIVKELIDEGLVSEVGNGQSRGGRLPRMLSLSLQKTRTIGFEVSETAILGGVCDLTGTLIAQTGADFLPNTPQNTVDRLAKMGEELLAAAGLTWKDISGVGVALPGHMDPARGVVRWSKPLGWKDVPLRRMCELRWGHPTDVVNDSMAGGMASHFLGMGRDIKNLVYMYLRFNVIEAHSDDTVHGVLGMGSGIIVNGEPYHGEFGAAGEITTLVSHPLVDARAETGEAFHDLGAFVEAVKDGQPSALAAMDRVARDMSDLIVHAVNFLEPGMLILGSDNSELRDALLVRLRRVLDEHRLRHEAGKTKIVASELGEYGVVRGAVVPALQRVFRMPRWA